jgi:hypothetical protein
MGFEPTIPVFERAKTVHDLDRVATVIGPRRLYRPLIYDNHQGNPHHTDAI